jgi:hypothetical protein
MYTVQYCRVYIPVLYITYKNLKKIIIVPAQSGVVPNSVKARIRQISPDSPHWIEFPNAPQDPKARDDEL